MHPHSERFEQHKHQKKSRTVTRFILLLRFTIFKYDHTHLPNNGTPDGISFPQPSHSFLHMKEDYIRVAFL